MNASDLQAAWDVAWPIITVAVTVASALDSALPQPKPGSNWLVARKVISFIAVNVGNASNGKQPSFLTWLVRVVTPVLQQNGTLPAEQKDNPNA